MRRAIFVAVVLMVSGLVGVSPGRAAPTPSRTLSVSGTDVSMYPDFDPAIARYAATTSASTGGTLTVTATPAQSGVVLVDGREAMTSTTTVTGLSAGDEVSVIFEDSLGTASYSVMYLPAGFPRLTVTVDRRDLEQPGLIAITPNAFNVFASQPSYNAIVDPNGVPVYAVTSGGADLDLKKQPNGELTVARATTTPGRTGTALVTLDDQFRESARREVSAPYIHTDNHDSVRLADGSTILLGYEPNAGTQKTDALIQKLGPSGTPVFTWNSGDDPTIADETTAGTSPDYAHINSVVSVGNGDVIASFRHFSAVWRIATVAHDGYQPGDVIWKLGGRDSTFTFPDDPEGGPCAQHTASELANGHILVFDNGTSGAFGSPNLCVNPDDRLGPTVPRGFTRVAEYALDTTAHTASLVWSYPDDHSRYAFFAGSARRLANGNTLIGWAADVHALATEVAPDKTTVWEVTTPAPPSDPPNLKQYATYRAELIPDLPDKIAPTVTMSPEDGAVLKQDSLTFPTSFCTDRGGSNLATCGGGGAGRFGQLDTSTVGPHTWRVTATDGAGNTTSVVHRYTVVPFVRQPDGVIRKSGSATWKGDGVYGPADTQTVHQGIRRRHTRSAFWLVQNDGEDDLNPYGFNMDAFALSGPGSSRRFRVRYLWGEADVTSQIVSGTFRSDPLKPGAWFLLRVEVTPTRHAPVGARRTLTLQARSTSAYGLTDRVATTVTARR